MTEEEKDEELQKNKPAGCVGCDRWPEGTWQCQMYPGREDRQHTRIGGCAGRTHNKELIDDDSKFKVNPLKASRRKQKGRK